MRKKRVRPVRRVHGLRSHLIILVFLSAAVLTGFLYIGQQQTLADQKINSADSGKKMDNPERGWYVMKGYQAETKESQKDILKEFEGVCKQIRRDKERLMEYQIQIRKPGAANRKIKEADLDTIKKELELMRKYEIQAIVRPVYDWDGKKGKEPSRFNTILTHIKQLGAIFSEYDDIIMCIEAGLLGPNGEWHSSSYLSTEKQRTIVETYLKATPKTMQISLRRPEFYRAIFKTNKPAEEASVKKGEDAGRVGFYNDGYLGSKNDLGTYTKWSRKKELEFQDNHNQLLFFGGEATMTSKYGQLFSAIGDMQQTHCTYLNREHYVPLKELWKKTQYTGTYATDPTYKNKTGYEYIRDHLGYRYILQISKIQNGVWRGESFHGEFTVWNSGFGNMIKAKDVSILLVKEEERIELPVDIDVRDWKRGLSGENYDITVPKEIDTGTWNIYLSVKSGSIPIQWANEVGYSSSIGGIKLGDIVVY